MPTVVVQTNNEHEQFGDSGESETTMSPQQTDVDVSPDNYDETPKYFRPLCEVFEVTKEVELEYEFLVMAVDELGNNSEAVRQKEWRLVMQNKIDLIQKYGT